MMLELQEKKYEFYYDFGEGHIGNECHAAKQ